MRVLVVAAGALIAAAHPAAAQPDTAIAFRNETCGTVTLTVQRETPIQPAGSGSAAPASCADAPGGCEVFAIDAGETRKTSPAQEGSPQIIDVKIEGRCDRGPVTVISGHCVVDLDERDTDDSELFPAIGASAKSYYASAVPAYDLTRRIGFRTPSRGFSRTPSAIAIALSDCTGDEVRQVCAAACRAR